MHYAALLDGVKGSYGVSFPDLPGCVAMGETVEEAMTDAADALRVWIEATEAMGRDVPAPRAADQIREDEEVREALSEGAMLVSVPLVRNLGRKTKANLSLDSGVLAAIDGTAGRLGINRSDMIETLAKDHLLEYA